MGPGPEGADHALWSLSWCWSRVVRLWRARPVQRGVDCGRSAAAACETHYRPAAGPGQDHRPRLGPADRRLGLADRPLATRRHQDRPPAPSPGGRRRPPLPHRNPQPGGRCDPALLRPQPLGAGHHHRGGRPHLRGGCGVVRDQLRGPVRLRPRHRPLQRPPDPAVAAAAGRGVHRRPAGRHPGRHPARFPRLAHRDPCS